MAEQFVGQEISSNQNGELFYWSRQAKSSSAEVDYLIEHKGMIYPLEVKSGKAGKLKSLQIFIEEKKSSFGIKISQESLPLLIPLKVNFGGTMQMT